ncbi:MAG: hypothetical protein LBT79_01800, partial [Elusimicrobiota bacterium]|nr:hypothetical protein [Elusimicrobiota bacterium]
MKKIIIAATISLFFNLSLTSYAVETAQYDGKIISEINIKTMRMSPEKAAKRFTLKKGDIFSLEKFDEAKQSLHNMRIFKTIDFDIVENKDNTVSINIDAKDGYYIFPLAFASGGSKNMVAVAVMESNLLKKGEMIFASGIYHNDGYAVSGGFVINNNFFSLSQSKLDRDEKEFSDGSFNSMGIKADDDELKQFSKPINLYKVKADSFRASWGFPIV